MSNDITINVTNETTESMYIAVFQKPEAANPNEMFDTLFPVAWRVLPLTEDQTTTITYPVSLQIAVKDYVPSYDASTRATIKDSEVGLMWEYVQDGDFTKLEKTDQKTKDGLLGCDNKAPKVIDVGLAKDHKILIVKRNVGQGRKAEFKLTPFLYFLADTDLTEGALVKSQVMVDKAQELDLTNLKSVDVILFYQNPDTKLLGWRIENKHFAS